MKRLKLLLLFVLIAPIFSTAQTIESCVNNCPDELSDSEIFCFGAELLTHADTETSWDICISGTFSSIGTCAPYSFECCFTIEPGNLCGCLEIPTRAGQSIIETYDASFITIRREGAMVYSGPFFDFLITMSSGSLVNAASASKIRSGGLPYCDHGDYIFLGSVIQ